LNIFLSVTRILCYNWLAVISICIVLMALLDFDVLLLCWLPVMAEFVVAILTQCAFDL